MKHIKLSRRAGGNDAGAIITVTDGAAEHLLENGYGETATAKQAKAYAESQGADDTTGHDDPEGDEPDYSTLSVNALNAEVDRRNEEREDEDTWVVPAGTKKAELIAALEADDAKGSDTDV